MWLRAELFDRRSAREHAYHAADAGIGSCLHIERGIAYGDNFSDIVDARHFHRMEEHIGRRPALRDIVAANDGGEIPLPSQALEDRRRNGAIKASGGGDEITASAQSADGIFGSGDWWHRTIYGDQRSAEFSINSFGELLMNCVSLQRRAVDEMSNDLSLGGTAPFGDLFGVDATS